MEREKRALRHHEGSSFGKQLPPGLGLELGAHRSVGLRSLRRGRCTASTGVSEGAGSARAGKTANWTPKPLQEEQRLPDGSSKGTLRKHPEGASPFSPSPTSSLPPVPPMGSTHQQQLAKAPYSELCTQGKLALRATPQLQTHHGKSFTRHYLHSLNLNAHGCGVGKYYPSQDQ